MSAAKRPSPVSIAAARLQAQEAMGYLAGRVIKAGNKEFEIPSMDLLDDDQQERWDNLQFELTTYDREPDTVINAYVDDKGNEFPARIIPGLPKRPHQKDGELVKPTYSVKVAQAILGEEGYADFKAAGGRANDVLLIIMDMNRERQERLSGVTDDTKSVGSDGDRPLEAAPDED